MNTFIIEDSFGRTTHFKGSLLVDETTDTDTGRKPQWADVEVWLTEGGNFIVRRTSNYRIRHSRSSCSRAEGFTLVEADETDTYLCTTCGADGSGAYAQDCRVSVDSYQSPQTLVDSFQQDGKYSHFSRTILSSLSEQSEAVNDCWNTVHVK